VKNHLANWGLTLWLLFDAYRCFRTAAERTPWAAANDIAVGAILILTAWFVIRRPPAFPAGSIGPPELFIVIGTLAVPFAYLLVPLESMTRHWSPLVLEWLSIGLLGWSTWSLGPSFSVLPQRRKIVTTGPYRFVRHPIYTSYLLLDLSYWILTSQSSAGAIWAVEAWLFFERARLEERVLRTDGEYEAYCHKVAYRFVPGLL
jgi:protein-S-isoprenylcysteine O-methyltransferase Ste14